MSVHVARIQPARGPGSRVSVGRSERGDHRAHVPSTDACGSAGHGGSPSPWENAVHTPSALTSYLLQCCVFPISLMRILQFCEKVGISRWPLWGKNFRGISKYSSFARNRSTRCGDAHHPGASEPEDLTSVPTCVPACGPPALQRNDRAPASARQAQEVAVRR